MTGINVALVILVFCLLGYFYMKHRHRYWSKRNVPYLQSKNLFLGHAGEFILNKVSFTKHYEIMYNELSSQRFGGYYNFLSPTLLVRDPELIKNIFTKDFDHFINREIMPLDENDPLSQHLVHLKGEKWRNLRIKLTPTFTSGKIKNMFHLMKECSQDLMEVLDKLAQDKEPVEIREMMARFTTDVISSCAFGIQSNSQKDVNSIFRVMGKKVTEPSLRSRMLPILNALSPSLRQILKISTFGKDVEEFFKSVVTDTIKHREENNICRNDFIDLLISLELTDDLLTAQCFVFFLAGFETSSGTITFALYELAKHPEIQETLFNEIVTTMNECNGKLTYDSLQNMSYLDRVISETLRMYPIIPALTRVCNKNYQLTPDLMIEKGTRVSISVRGLHYDPQHFKNPYEFDPEHFSKEAKTQRHHYCYLPFGEGPHICIGMRFGLTQIKLGLATIIKDYSVSLSSKMDGPLHFKRGTFSPVAVGGVWLTFNKRISS